MIESARLAELRHGVINVAQANERREVAAILTASQDLEAEL
jgi:hypothetical protein